MHNPALEMRGVCKRLGHTSVLRGVDLQIADRESVAILGPSGGGKTTMLRIVAGIISPDAGTVRFPSLKIEKTHPSQLEFAPRHNTTLVFQDIRLFPNLTGLRNCTLGLYPPRAELVRDLLCRLLVEHCATKFPREMSHGERQRIAIARALVREPKMLLLDEPTSALDERSQSALLTELVAARTRGAAILAVSHDWEFVARFAQRVFRLDNGTLNRIDVKALNQAKRALGA